MTETSSLYKNENNDYRLSCTMKLIFINELLSYEDTICGIITFSRKQRVA